MLVAIKPSPSPARLAAFWIFQLALIVGMATWASARSSRTAIERSLPPLRSEPLSFKPTYDFPVVISDEQLVDVLEKLGPKSLGSKTKINHIDHALRFWGANANFERADLLSGEQMRGILTDTRRFTAMFGPDIKPLLIDFGAGVRVRTQEGFYSSSHVDHTMAGLAEVGTPLNFPVITPTRETTYRAIVEQSLRDFSLNQVEYEWSALTYALFLPPVTRWYTSEGQEMTFDRLAARIMRQELPQGVCFANHRLYTLVAFLRINEQTPIISAETRADIMRYLGAATERLVASQHVDGYWNGNWPTKPTADTSAGVTSGDAIADRILATGHALEWWAMAPEELHPPRAILASAGQWLVRTINDLTPEKTEEYYTYLSHAGRALSLWRGKWPTEVIK